MRHNTGVFIKDMHPSWPCTQTWYSILQGGG